MGMARGAIRGGLATGGLTLGLLVGGGLLLDGFSPAQLVGSFLLWGFFLPVGLLMGGWGVLHARRLLAGRRGWWGVILPGFAFGFLFAPLLHLVGLVRTAWFAPAGEAGGSGLTLVGWLGYLWYHMGEVLPIFGVLGVVWFLILSAVVRRVAGSGGPEPPGA